MSGFEFHRLHDLKRERRVQVFLIQFSKVLKTHCNSEIQVEVTQNTNLNIKYSTFRLELTFSTSPYTNQIKLLHNHYFHLNYN